MKSKEDVQNDIGGNDGFIEDNLGHFSVAGSLTANGFVAWVFHVATAIADLDVAYAAKLHKARI